MKLNILDKSKVLCDKKLLEGDFRSNRTKASINDKNPTLLVRMKSGFLYLMDKQFIPGYCILTRYPIVNELNDIDIKDRNAFLMDMNIVGEAIQNVVSDYKRMNYSILGNTDEYLHAHIYPRYNWENEERIKMPVWLYDIDEYWRNDKYNLSSKDKVLGERIADEVIRLCKKYY